MPTWGELLTELGQLAQEHQAAVAQAQAQGQPLPTQGPADQLRRRYLRRLSEKTERATIIYATAWYETRPINPQTLSVSLGDVRGFMEACSNIESRELDLILHSPGGDPDAAESIMSYLRERFDSIRAIVPLAAMSAATMMALACDEVVMGEHSQLGPIDPQITILTPEGPRTAPAQAIKDQFEKAQAECAADPSRIAAWMPLLRSLGPGLLAQCDAAQKRTEEFVAKALAQYIFDGDADAANAAAAWFADHGFFKSHGRQVTRDDARRQGIKVADLEDDGEFQDLVLSVSHATQLTFSATPCAKLVENHLDRAWLQLEGAPAVELVMQPAPPGAPGGPPVQVIPPGTQPPPTGPPPGTLG